MFLVALLAVAVQAAPPPSPSPSPAAKTEKGTREPKVVAPPTKGERKYVKGSLGGLDLDNKTVRFVDENGKSQVWPIDQRLAAVAPARAEALLKSLQPGQPVTIVYQEDEGHPVVIDVKLRTPGERQEGER